MFPVFAPSSPLSSQGVLNKERNVQLALSIGNERSQLETVLSHLPKWQGNKVHSDAPIHHSQFSPGLRQPRRLVESQIKIEEY